MGLQYGFKIQKLNGDTTLVLRTPIDKSSLKVGDTFEMLKRNEQVVVATFNNGSNNNKSEYS